MNNLTKLTNVLPGNVISSEFSYTYDGAGNQLTKVDANGTTSYTYDKLDRLETVSEPDGNGVTYTFDNNGNIKTKDLVHPANHTYSFKQGGELKEMNSITSHTISYNNDASNKLIEITETIDNTGAVSSPYVGTVSITVDLDYDENGNLITTTKGGDADTEVSSYKYNQLNQMIEYEGPNSVITNYSYDGNGLRKTKTSGGNTTGFYYSGGNVINETENGVLRARNIRGINIIAREDNLGTKAYYLYNGHGDTINLVTNTGEILNTYDYDPYGKAKVATEGSIKNPYRYAGEYYDEESELYYLRARYYDPNIARFISEDSYKGDASYPLSLNLYTYTYNNPIKYVDPSGNDPYRQKNMQKAQKLASESYFRDFMNEENMEALAFVTMQPEFLVFSAWLTEYAQLQNTMSEIQMADEAIQATSEATELIEETVKLSKNKTEHVLKNHTQGRMQNTVGKMMEKGLQENAENLVDSKGFFNTSWSEQKVIDATNQAYNKALSDGFTHGNYTTKVFGENITVNMENGVFRTAWGDIKLTLSDFGF